MITTKRIDNSKRNTEATDQGKTSVPNKAISTKALSSFLNGRKVEKGLGLEFTHTSLSGGSYYIQGEDMDEFYEVYKKAVGSPDLYLTERPKSFAPIIVDLDLRGGKEYSEEQIKEIVRTLMGVIDEYIKIPKETDIYVLRKPARLDKGVIKNGMHIEMPDVVAMKEFHEFLRNSTYETIYEILAPNGYTNTANDIYDKGVSSLRNNWLMYGSRKPGELNAWRVEHVYVYDNGHLADKGDIPEDHELVEILSIRDKYDVTEMKMELPVIVKPPKSEAGSQMTSLTYQNIDSYENVRTLVGLLNKKRADDYHDWIQLGWCLHNINKSQSYLSLWDEFSTQSYKYKEGECEKQWSRMRDEGLGIGSLCKWAREDSPEAYEEIINKLSQEITLEQLLKSSKTYKYEYVKKVFEKRMVKITTPICYVEEQGGEELIHVRNEGKLLQTYRNTFCIKEVDGKPKSTKFIPLWLDDPMIRTYRKMDFLPPPIHCTDDVYNTWTGFAIDNIEVDGEGDIAPFLEHISILVGRKEECITYFIKWLAQIIQEPGRLIGIALVFVSKEGAGKNVFFDLFSEIIGVQYYTETNDIEKDLFGRFANGRRNKLLIDVDEARSKETFSRHDALKNIITSSHLNYEQKGVDPISIRNYARLIFTSNNEMCVKVTENDRRYVIFETSNEKIGDQVYFQGLAEYMSDKRNQKAIIEYLRSVDIKGYNFITSRPVSETYSVIKSSCGDFLTSFMEYLWIEHNTKPEVVYTGAEMLTNFHLFLKDRLNVSEDTIRSWNYKMLGMRLNKMIAEGVGITKQSNYGAKKVMAYKINLNELKSYLEKKGIITEETYMFIDLEDTQEDDLDI